MLTVEISGDAAVTRVALAGELDLDSKALLAQAVLEAPAKVVELDLAALTYCDSAGIGALVTAQREARDDGRALYLVNVGGMVQTILQVSGVLTELTRRA
ncbi:MAG: STAS domain-containing protein [Hamadaea sp.]|uniref:STAS domain-containing protein n=1 Tax=Hamadaea sp. NPDC050747 TaxID=3155789 RepID=UPI0017A09E42|nr:STAS domain-containing protein [Hamadaea sp.]NUR49548.1 STAS domain-containing protein [Hamadaea sp.]NUT03008.1 STAS domain-containing protein [Hamadaea sp.]